MRRNRGGAATAGSCAIGWMRSARWKRCCRSPDIRTSIPPIRFRRLSRTTAPLFEATEIAHPLLPAATAVSNSLTFRAPAQHLPSTAQVLIVSGSNMSGKSTLMRTVGINALLALAGAPVRAERLRLTPLAIGTCLRHTDSLQEHRSGFYTEALRIRAICDLLDGPLPVLFLFDELLSGTNSKDRRDRRRRRGPDDAVARRDRDGDDARSGR